MDRITPRRVYISFSSVKTLLGDMAKDWILESNSVYGHRIVREPGDTGPSYPTRDMYHILQGMLWLIAEQVRQKHSSHRLPPRLGNSVILSSGRTGWRQHLRDVYQGDKEVYTRCMDIYHLHLKLGYASAEEAWNDDPVVEGSTDPNDYRKVP